MKYTCTRTFAFVFLPDTLYQTKVEHIDSKQRVVSACST